VNNELRKFGGASVGVETVPYEKLREVAELRDREVGSEGRWFSFLSDDANACCHTSDQLSLH